MSEARFAVGDANADLQERLDKEISTFNAATGHHDGRELNVAVCGDNGDLRAGLYGWTWGGCGYIEPHWVRDDQRSHGLGAESSADNGSTSSPAGSGRRTGTARHPSQLATLPRDSGPRDLPTTGAQSMRTLHFGLRVADLDRSLAFYAAVGYEIVGDVPETGLGHLTMLRLPGDEFVTIELVHNPSETAADGGTRLSHFVIHVDSMDVTLTELATHGIDAEAPTSPDGSADFRTTWIVDPDGNRIELVQWPAGHADGITAADWAK